VYIFDIERLLINQLLLFLFQAIKIGCMENVPIIHATVPIVDYYVEINMMDREIIVQLILLKNYLIIINFKIKK